MTEKIPPQSIENEMAVLGAMIQNNTVIPLAMEILKTEYFYMTKHRIIYQEIVSLYNQGKPVDIVVLANSSDLPSMGGQLYLTILVGSFITSANIMYYAKIVYNKALQRQLINASIKISEMAYATDEDDAEQTVIAANQLIADITNNASGSVGYSTTTDDKSLTTYIEHVEKKYLSGGQISGILTGYYDIDYMLSGLQPQEVTVVAACTSMGKSCFITNIANNVIRKGSPVGMFVLESSQYRLHNRMMAMATKINSIDIGNGRISGEQYNDIVKSAGEYHDKYAPLCTLAVGGVTLETITAVAMKMRRVHGIELLIIDHIGRIIPPKKQSREQEIAAISNHIDNLSKKIDIPIIAVSQLSRKVSERVNKRPVLSDLRDSGTVEQDAANVILLYRDNYYNSKSEAGNITEIIIPKTRDGRVGMVELLFQPEYSRFVNLSEARYA